MKKAFLALITFFAALMIFAISGIMAIAEATPGFADALSNGRVSSESSLELEIKDGSPSSTRALYQDKVNLSSGFEFNISIADLCKDGGFRITFLSTAGDYPMEGYGDGFGVYFWDETAWGHTENTWLRADLMGYNKSGNKFQDAKRVFSLDSGNYYSKNMYIKAWSFDDNNYAIQINTDGTKDAGTAAVIGTIAKSACGAIDPTNCVLMITPEIDSSRAHSYERNVKLSLDLASPFTDALGSNRVASSKNLVLNAKDGVPSSTRAYYSQDINLNNVFEAELTINDLCKDGGLRLTFLSSSNDYPMEGYGDGFGVYFWDETAWGHAENTWLRADLMGYNKSGNKTQDAKRVFSLDSGNYYSKKMYIKAWNFDENNYAIQINTDGTKDAGTAAVIGTIAKSACGAIDPTKCTLMITPEVDSSRAHSYERDVNLSLSILNGAGEYVNTTINSPENATATLSCGSVVAKGTNVTVKAVAKEGYHIKSVTVNGSAVELNANDEYVIENVSTDISVVVEAEINEVPVKYYEVAISETTNGTITANKTGSVSEETEITFTVKAAAGYILKSFKINGEEKELTDGKYTLTLSENVTASAEFEKEPAKADVSEFKDALGNGRVTATKTDNVHSIELEFKDGQAPSTRAYYSTNIDITKVFEAYVTIKDVCKDGGFRITFLSSSNDYPMEGYGDGFGIYFWDETAWGYAESTSLRCDFMRYNKEGLKTQEAKRAFSGPDTYIGKTMYIKVWEFDADNYAIQINIDGTTDMSTNAAVGTVSKASLGAFDPTNCVLMITPEIDSSRPHSYERNVKLDIFNISGKGEYVAVSTAVSEGEGTIETSCGASASKGSKVTIKVSPKAGYEIVEVLVNGNAITLDENSTYIIEEANEDITVSAKFKLMEVPPTIYSIAIEQKDGGTIAIDSDLEVVEGTKVTVTVKANKGYAVKALIVNGETIELEDSKAVIEIKTNTTITAAYEGYSVDADSRFQNVYENNDRVNAVEKDGKTELTLVTDRDKHLSRAVYTEKVSLNELEFTFRINNFNTDGAIRISFLTKNDDYPMEKYGEGFCLYFWDETAWGKPNLTSLRSDFYAYGYGETDKTLIKEDRCISGGEIIGAEVYVKIWNYSESSLACHIYINGEFACGGEVSKILLSGAFNWNDCYMIVTPEIDDNRAHSYASDVSITIGEIKTTKSEVDPVKPGGEEEDPKEEIEEFTITYKSGDNTLRVAYAEKGEEFPLFKAPDVEGYTFDAWYLDKEFKNKLEDRTATEDIVVYARYIKNQEEVKTTTAATPENPTQSQGSVIDSVKGCFSSVTILSIMPLAIATLGVCIIKKRREE